MELKFKNPGQMTHAYIISSPDKAAALAAAQSMAAAAVCQREVDVPCGECRACRKVKNGVHPDVITISRLTDDKGKEKREINVDQVRACASDAMVLPNEAERKVYIIDGADTMNLPAQNAALKLLEEPPKRVMFLLCVQNSELLLETVRSRCVEINCGGEAAAADEDTVKLVLEFYKLAALNDRAKLYRWCAANEDMDTRTAGEFFTCALDIAADMLCKRRDSYSMTAARLASLAALMEKCIGYLKVNTGVKHIFGLLAVDAAED